MAWHWINHWTNTQAQKDLPQIHWVDIWTFLWPCEEKKEHMTIGFVLLNIGFSIEFYY